MPTLGIVKPKKSERPNIIRRNGIKKRDREIAKETETFICADCGWVGKTDPAHVIPRRFQKSRHDPLNILRKCRLCHSKERYNASEQRLRIKNYG